MKGQRSAGRGLSLSLVFACVAMAAFLLVQGVWAAQAMTNGTGKTAVYDELPQTVKLYRDEDGTLADLNADNAERLLDAEEPYLKLKFDDEDHARFVYNRVELSGHLSKDHRYNGKQFYSISPDATSRRDGWYVVINMPQNFDVDAPRGRWEFSLVDPNRGNTGRDYVVFTSNEDATYGVEGKSAIYVGGGSSMAWAERACTWTRFASADATVYVFDYEGGRLVAVVQGW